jgi:ATP-dependent Clp protease ATP-binding subunit ClpA
MADFQKAKEKIMSSLSDFFSPEFLNRIDKITVFEPLDKKDIKKIVELQLQDLSQRLSAKNVTLSYDTKILNFITKQVYNPEF